jgi:tetratricopeptide (TPR) repeat protein
MPRIPGSAVLFSVLAACASLPEGAECRALTGEPLFPPELPAAVRADREERLAQARAVLERDPGDLEAIVWLGRRTAYLGRYREAVAVFTEGLRRHPDSAQLLRHRGHRWISLREFENAERDLSRAAQLVRGKPDAIEPDGLPTPGRPPHSTLHFNIHYHLGLARYLQADFAGAALAWFDCLDTVDNDESRVAVSHWLWSALARAGEPDAAQAVLARIGADMDVVENQAYHRLCLP